MEWELKERDYYYELYTTSKEFNGDVYVASVQVYRTLKSDKFWFHVSSGKKRKHFEVFEDKEYKSHGGMKALFWIRDAMYDFPKFYKNHYNKKQYLVVGWADTRRRNIYSRLQKEGFQFMIDEGRKVLIKKLA